MQTIKKLSSMPDDKYVSIITNLIINSAPNDTAEVILSDRDKRGFPLILRKRLIKTFPQGKTEERLLFQKKHGILMEDLY